MKLTSSAVGSGGGQDCLPDVGTGIGGNTNSRQHPFLSERETQEQEIELDPLLGLTDSISRSRWSSHSAC